MPVSFINNASIAAAAGISTSKLGAGAVLQVVQFSTTSTVSMASGASFATLGWSVSITPTSSTNKVLLIGHSVVYSDTTNSEPHITIYRGGTNIGGSSGFTDHFNSAGRIVTVHPYIYLDSPATTSSTTYTLYARNDTAGTAYFGANNCTTTLIALEIAG